MTEQQLPHRGIRVDQEVTGNTSEFPSLHPAEYFPWVSPQDYFAIRDAFTHQYEPQAYAQLKYDPTYRRNRRLRRDSAYIYSRAAFVSGFMGNNIQTITDDIPVEVVRTRTIRDTTVVMRTSPRFIYNGKGIELSDIDQSLVDNVELETVAIEVNMNWLDHDVQHITDPQVSAYYIGDQEDPIVSHETGIEQMGRYAEVAMVEEVSHAAYMINHTGSSEKKWKLIKEIQESVTTCERLSAANSVTSDDFNEYRLLPIEQDGFFWTKRFCEEYYPEFPIVPLPDDAGSEAADAGDL